VQLHAAADHVVTWMSSQARTHRSHRIAGVSRVVDRDDGLDR